MKKAFSVVAMIAGITIGSVVVAAVDPLGIAGALEHRSSSEARDHHGRRARARELVRELGDAAAGALGMTREELRAELREGNTLNEIAAERGVDPATVEAALLDVVSNRVDTALANGRITEEQAAKIRERARERIDRLMDREFGQRRP